MLWYGVEKGSRFHVGSGIASWLAGLAVPTPNPKPFPRLLRGGRLMAGGIWDRKPMDTDGETGYRRILGLADLSAIGVAAIIGAGIFVFLGQEAQATGPAVVLALILGGAAALLAALSYAEASAILPGSGSAYAFAYMAAGNLPAFIVGWLFLNAYAIGNAGVAIGWTTFFFTALDNVGMRVPDLWSLPPTQGGIMNLPAILFTAAITWITTLPLRSSTLVNNALVALKLGIVVLVIIVGAFYVDTANWTPFAPGGIESVAASTAVLFFAYLGFDTIAATGSEAKEPKRHLPVAILLSIGICTLLYVMMAGVFTGMGVPSDTGTRAPIAVAFENVGQNWAAGIITAGALIALSTVMYAFHLAMARILQAMARDGFMPAFLGTVSPRTGVPVNATIAVGVISGTAAGFISLADVIDMAVEASIAIYAAVSGVILIARHVFGKPDGFRVPVAFHAVAILALIAVVVFGIGSLIHLLFFAWVGLGLVLYAVYSHRGSLRVQAEAESS